MHAEEPIFVEGCSALFVLVDDVKHVMIEELSKLTAQKVGKGKNNCRCLHSKQPVYATKKRRMEEEKGRLEGKRWHVRNIVEYQSKCIVSLENFALFTFLNMESSTK